MTISIHQQPTRNTEQRFATDPDLDLDDPDFEDLDDLLEEEDDLDSPDPEPSDDLDDLELLMVESTLEAEQRRAVKRQQYTTGTTTPYVEAAKYKSLFACAVFIHTSCSHCNSQTSVFSHFAEYQEFSAKHASKPNCWKRLTDRPQVLSRPRYISTTAAGCSCCVSHTEALNLYATLTEQKQLTLPFMTEGATL